MPFSHIFGHKSVTDRLEQVFHADRLPSSYLFLGMPGVGKASVAKAFARKINCEKGFSCGVCENCKLFIEEAHPDFVIIKPSGQFIKIGQIKELISKLNLKPSLATKRVVLVNHAEAMNQESANAFLKILEEPPLDTLIILTAQEEGLLLDTILSRCQKLTFKPLGIPEIEGIIARDYTIAPDAKELVLAYSNGRLRIDWIEQSHRLMAVRSQALHILQHLRMVEMEAHSLQIESILKQNLESYFLEFIASLLRDRYLISMGMDSQIINQDLAEELHNWPCLPMPELLVQGFDKAIDTEMSLKLPIGKALAMDALLIYLKRLFDHELVV